MVGDRGFGAVKFYSAVGSDYLKPHFRSLLYGQWSAGGNPERQLFPRVLPVVLAAVALWPPLSVTRIAYAIALFVAVDGSFGLNGSLYPWLYTYLSPFKGLRVPARFSMLSPKSPRIPAATARRESSRGGLVGSGCWPQASWRSRPSKRSRRCRSNTCGASRQMHGVLPGALRSAGGVSDADDPAGFYWDTRYCLLDVSLASDGQRQ
jgi:hypothetical protein